MAKQSYFTSGAIAAVCGVNVKTIHNWADKEYLPCFRTPGRQLRFKPREIVPWLREKGYDVPRAMADIAKADAAAAVEATSRRQG